MLRHVLLTPLFTGVLLSLSINFAYAQVAFVPSPLINPTPSLNCAETVLTADFNNDTHPDLLSFCDFNAKPYVFLGDGAGAFVDPVITDVKAGNPDAFLETAAVADFNNDGVQDLIVGNVQVLDQNINHVHLAFLPGTGAGNFLVPICTAGAEDTNCSEIGISVGTLALIATHLNGDNLSDFVASTSDGFMHVFLNQPDTPGHFSHVMFDLFNNDTASVHWLASGDMDQDGDIDIIGLSEGSYGTNPSLPSYHVIKPSRLLYLKNDGSGEMSAYQEYLRMDSATDFLRGLAVGDLNSDSFPDIVTVLKSGSNYATKPFMNNGTNTLTEMVGAFTVGNASFPNIAIADVNRDRQNDLLVTNSNSDTLSVLLRTTTGFAAQQIVSSSGDFPNSVVVADFNHDDSIDFAVANENSDSQNPTPFLVVGLNDVVFGTGFD